MKTVTRIYAWLMLWAVSLTAADLNQNKFTQVVGEVSIVNASTKASRKAELDGVVTAPDLIRTGPNSRAELKAADDTLTRIGANTIFSFDTRGRGVNLQQGTVLFHSPKGKGGGIIKSGGSSAAVLGTTLIVSANPEGGFKTILLEGQGRVDRAEGGSRRLDAGQLVFVLPQGGLSPTVNVDLGRLVGASALMKGYSTPLPSLAKVSAAVTKQDESKESGSLEETGLLVGNSATEATVTAITPATFTAALSEKKTSIEKAWDRNVKLEDPYLPERQLFSRNDPRFPKSSPWKDAVTDVMLGDKLEIKTKDVVIPDAPTDLGSPTVDRTFGIIAKKLEIKGDTDFHAPPAVAGGAADPNLVLAGENVTFSENSQVRYTGRGNLLVGSKGSLKTKNVSIRSAVGALTVISAEGSVDMNGGSLQSGSGSKLEVRSSKKDIDLRGVTLTARDLVISAARDARLNGVNFVNEGSQSGGGPGSISIEATTIVMQNVDLPSNRPVNLRSADGFLAPSPNTGAVIINRAVNFRWGVTCAGAPAELSVRNWDGARPDANIIVSALPHP